MAVLMMSNKVSQNFTLLIVASIFLISCSDNDTKLTLDERSIIYCSEGSPDSFNPQLTSSGTTSDATSKLLYNSLVVFEETSNKLTNSLAKSWHVTKDGKKITFYLRQNVTFHQTDYFTPTRMLNADDILFTFNRILDSEHPYHYVSGGHYPFFS
jgi:cationic peptide transport system substrate-binding protein